MSDTPTKIIVDCSTGEQMIVPLTAQEIAAADQAAAAAAQAKADADAAAQATAALKESAKAKLIAGTPLTAEEAAVLVI
jgi:hypothetical protein